MICHTAHTWIALEINRLLRNWGRGFTFLLLESTAKLTPPHHLPLCLEPRRKGYASHFPYESAHSLCIMALLWTRVGPLPLAGQGAGKDVVYLGFVVLWLMGPSQLLAFQPPQQYGPRHSHSKESDLTGLLVGPLFQLCCLPRLSGSP